MGWGGGCNVNLANSLGKTISCTPCSVLQTTVKWFCLYPQHTGNLLYFIAGCGFFLGGQGGELREQCHAASYRNLSGAKRKTDIPKYKVLCSRVDIYYVSKHPQVEICAANGRRACNLWRKAEA